MKNIDSICIAIVLIVFIITIGSCSYYTDKTFIDRGCSRNVYNVWVCSSVEGIKK
jgi:hypothetical protein